MTSNHPIEERLRALCLVREVDRVPRGHIRFQTIFRYPDGSSIDLFVPQPLVLFDELVLSDLGQTMTWLTDVQVRPWQSKKRQALLRDALEVLEVRQDGGQLVVALNPDLSNLTDAVARLGQACVRAADLMYTRRNTMQTGISEEFEEILSDAVLEYEPNVALVGRFGNPLKVDFLVKGVRSTSAVLTLSSQNSTSAHGVALEVFSKWHDLDVPERSEQRVTVFDDRYDVYREQDLARCGELSIVIPLSRRGEIVEVLAA